MTQLDLVFPVPGMSPAEARLWLDRFMCREGHATCHKGHPDCSTDLGGHCIDEVIKSAIPADGIPETEQDD